jgi:hypothetical protein
LSQYPDSDNLASLRQHNLCGLTDNCLITALEQALSKIKPIRICEDGSIWGRSDSQDIFIAKMNDDVNFSDTTLTSIHGRSGFERYAEAWGEEILDTRKNDK